MYTWQLMLVASFLALETGLSHRSTQDMSMLQYYDRRIAHLEDRLTKYDQTIQAYEQKLYDLSKEMRSHMDRLNVYKLELRNQVDSIAMRMDRAERDIEYLENNSPSQPHVDIDDRILERQVKDALQETRRKLNLKTDCSAIMTSVKSLKIVKKAGDVQGAWLRDPSKGSTKVYFFSGTSNSTMLEFTSLQAFTEDNYFQAARKVYLPFPWQGTGHAVNNGFVYYHKAGTANEIVKVHIRNQTASDTMLLQGAGRLPAYSLMPQTFIQLAVDELGLWAIHADPDFGGKLVVTKLDRTRLEVEHTWDTPCKSKDAEVAFLVCGTLHVVYNTPYSGRSSVQCLFDIHDTIHSREMLPIFFPKRYTSHSSMHYHPKDKQIYAWDDGYQTIYKVDTRRKNTS
ncbi:olfactomedin-like protein 1 [Arapaima gigas]